MIFNLLFIFLPCIFQISMVSMLSFIEYKDNCVFMFKDTNSVFIRRYKLIPFSVLCNDYTTLLSNKDVKKKRGGNDKINFYIL